MVDAGAAVCGGGAFKKRKARFSFTGRDPSFEYVIVVPEFQDPAFEIGVIDFIVELFEHNTISIGPGKHRRDDGGKMQLIFDYDLRTSSRKILLSFGSAVEAILITSSRLTG